MQAQSGRGQRQINTKPTMHPKDPEDTLKAHLRDQYSIHRVFSLGARLRVFSEGFSFIVRPRRIFNRVWFQMSSAAPGQSDPYLLALAMRVEFAPQTAMRLQISLPFTRNFSLAVVQALLSLIRMSFIGFFRLHCQPFREEFASLSNCREAFTMFLLVCRYCRSALRPLLGFLAQSVSGDADRYSSARSRLSRHRDFVELGKMFFSDCQSLDSIQL
jgi:hypothetical protein